MTRSVHIVDYGIGNLLSVARAIERIGGEPRLTRDGDEIASAERLILPGVGAFEACMTTLTGYGLVEPTTAFARSGRPFLGICVGMQMLFDHSVEFGQHAGLGLLPGYIGPIPQSDRHGVRKVPHIGWGTLALPPRRTAWTGTVLDSATPGSTAAYFLHSFSALPTDDSDWLAVADYSGYPVCAAVARDNLIGCQFHPEKSGPAGLEILARFMALQPLGADTAANTRKA